MIGNGSVRWVSIDLPQRNPGPLSWARSSLFKDLIWRLYWGVCYDEWGKSPCSRKQCLSIPLQEAIFIPFTLTWCIKYDVSWSKWFHTVSLWDKYWGSARIVVRITQGSDLCCAISRSCEAYISIWITSQSCILWVMNDELYFQVYILILNKSVRQLGAFTENRL